MTSLDFELRWFRWDDIPAAAPKEKGVYIMRTPKERPDIVYIGKGGSQEGVWRCLSQYRHPGYDNGTRSRVKDLIIQDGAVEIGWILTENFEREEARLLGRFRQAHGRLPLWNRQMPRTRC
jgi:hypothetical protein